MIVGIGTLVFAEGFCSCSVVQLEVHYAWRFGAEWIFDISPPYSNT